MARTHPLSMLVAALLIGIGGFAGSNLRYFFDLVVPSALAATLLVNVIGCAALGFFLYEDRYTGLVHERSHLVVLTGFISSFTTYSTFVVDAVQSRPAVAVVYVIGTYGLGFAAVLLGRAGARRVATGTGVGSVESAVESSDSGRTGEGE